MRSLIIFIFTIVLIGCSSDSEYTKQHNWKYGDGFYIGDWLYFENSNYYQIQNDTIFKHDTAQAIIVGIDRQFGGDVELAIISIKTGEPGTYHAK